MRFSFVVAAIVVLLLNACNGMNTPTSEIGPEPTLVEIPEGTEPSPTGASPTPKSPENTLIETPEYTGVIFSEGGALKFSYRFGQGSSGFWEPSSDDVARAETCVRQFLASLQDDPKPDTYEQEKSAFILKNLEQYRRQYVGIVVNGEKRIWINSFFADYSFPYWQSGPVDVDDGGKYFWQIEYDLLKDECINFYVHGES